MLLKKFLSFFGKNRKQNLNRFLNNVSGVIHIGANAGQERKLYHRHNLDVIWIEAIPAIFRHLKTNIAEFDNQIAFKALITDLDDGKYKFHVSSNYGRSSSIFNLKNHKIIWPEIEYEKSINLESITLASFCEREKIDLGKYQALILDTQGSELLVLKGSLPVLHNFEYVKVEVADFEIYEGCCKFSDVDKFMTENGYKEFSRKIFAKKEGVGNCFDVVYKKLD